MQHICFARGDITPAGLRQNAPLLQRVLVWMTEEIHATLREGLAIVAGCTTLRSAWRLGHLVYRAA